MTLKERVIKAIFKLTQDLKLATYISLEGQTIEVNDETKEVFLVDGETSVAATDGEHLLENGKVLVVESGLLKEIKDAPITEELEAETEELATEKALATGEKVIIADDQSVTIIAADGVETPAPDGTHILSDGSAIRVEGGKLVEEIPASELSEMVNKTDELVESLETALAEITRLKTELSAVTTEKTALSTKLEKLSKEPLGEKIKPGKQVKLSTSEMSVAERACAHFGL